MKRTAILLPLLVAIFLLLGACDRNEQGLLIHTADPALSILVPIAAAASLPEVVVDPAVEVIEAEEEGQADCIIAGNINSAGELIYHLPNGAYYSRVKIDLDRGEEWLCTEADAVAKGYRKSER